MNHLSEPDLRVSRRHWIALAIASLSGCGGGSPGTTEITSGSGSGGGGNGFSGNPTTDAGTDSAGADQQTAAAPGTGGTGSPGAPGTGGTGIYSQGSISAFGSVVLNGIHFDERAADITIDGGSAPSDRLRLGMVATVVGERYADGVSGRADSIEVWSIAQGEVSAVASGSFTVMGMHVQTRGSTFYEGVPSAAGMAVGQWVTVWGLQADAQGGNWIATRVSVGPAGESMVGSGFVVEHHDERRLNGILLSGDRADDLHTGRLVRVVGRWDTEDDALRVSGSHLIDVRGGSPAPAGVEVEIEGVVTALLPGSRLMLGSTEVDARAVPSVYAQLRPGMEIEIDGTWQGAVLMAREIEIEDD